MRKLQNRVRKLHRVLAYLLFLQLGAWIIGGAAFALLPFDSLVKGGSSVADADPGPLPADWAARLPSDLTDVTAVATAESSQGPLLKLQRGEQTEWLRLVDGGPAVRADADAIARYARQLYSGNGSLQDVRHLEQAEPRYLGLVDELYGRGDVWLAEFDDGPGTRLYFEAATGRYLTVRNDYWVLFDALWRLHIMDYRSGEDFNNWLLRLFALSALLFVVSGIVLGGFTAQRALTRRA